MTQFFKYFTILIFLFCASFAFGQSNEMEINEMEIIGHFIFRPDISIRFTNEAESHRQLDRMAEDLKSRNLSAGQVLVSGFAAMEPTTLSPVTLTLNRSSFIINELVKRGVPWELFTTPVGYGYVSFWGSLYENRRAVVSIINSAPDGSRRAVNNNTDPAADGTSDFTDFLDRLTRLEMMSGRPSSEGDESPIRAGLITSADGSCHCSDFLDRLEKVEIASERLSDEWDESPIRTGAITGWFAGVGPEINGYTRTNFSVGGYVSLGVELFFHYVLGVRIGYYSNLKDGEDKNDLDNMRTDTFEAAFLFRYYLPLENIFSGIYIEGNVGMTSFRELKEAYIAPHGGIALGWRFEFLERFYVDPAIRIGSPLNWGIGAACGVIF